MPDEMNGAAVLPAPHLPSPPEVATRIKRNKKRSKATRPHAGRLEVMKDQRPPMRDAIQLILGKRVMSGQAIYDELVKRGWTPVSGKPRSYVLCYLAISREHFQAIKRGVYRVRTGAPRVKPEIVQRFPVGTVAIDRSTKTLNALKGTGAQEKPVKKSIYEWLKKPGV